MGFATYLKELRSLASQGFSAGGGSNLVALREVDSTNALARRIAADYSEECVALEQSWIVAFSQEAGRGRQGRGWVSPEGAGVYATLMLPLGEDEETSAKALVTLPLLVASALCESVDADLGETSCRLRWPNDLMIDGGKLGGILIEAVTCEGSGKVALVGFGLNHQPRDLAAVEQPTTAFTEHAEAPPTLARWTLKLLSAVEERLDHLGDAEYAIDRYRGFSLHQPGDRLRHRTGEETLVGTFRGFDPQGYLRLETEDGEILLASGEVADR